LGLATVYGIVRQSGGSIYVYSEPGRGTTFKVYFPAYVKPGTPVSTVAIAEAPASRALVVLLVEDDPAVRGAARTVLERLGHSVVSAGDVPEALEIIRSGAESLDVVLTDAVMPGQSGLDLADILVAERPNLPVVLMSGYSEEAVSGDRTVPPGVLFVEKPFTGDDIARAFANVKPTAGTTAVETTV
jgi:two-component system, cell cycle sensor histidine kinase and response regulator CckA